MDRREGPRTHRGTEDSLEREKTEGVSAGLCEAWLPNTINSSYQRLPPNGRVTIRDTNPALLTAWDSAGGNSSQACQDLKPTSQSPVLPHPFMVSGVSMTMTTPVPTTMLPSLHPP